MFSKLFLQISAALAAVVELNADNFDAFIAENSHALVKFYAPWCGHCKKLAPEWEAASDLLKNVVLAKMDLAEEANKEFKERFGVRGFPTIKYFEKGHVSDYDGGRTKEKIVSWAKMMSSELIFLGSRDEVEGVRKQFPGAPIFGYEGSLRGGNPEFQNFQQFCRDNKSLIQCVAFAGRDGEQPIMELFRPSNTSSRVQFDWETTADEMKKFVRGERLEYFAEVTSDNYSEYTQSEIPMIWFAGNKEQFDNVYETVESAAKKTRGHFAWVWMNMNTMGAQAPSMLGISEGPAFVMRAPQGMKGSYRGPATTEVSTEELVDFAFALKEGTHPIYLKSEDIPEANDESVRTLVGKNIASVLAENDEYILMIYAPWCGHCKSFKPVYEDLATKMSEAGSKMLLAKIDATANDIDIPELSYTGFPTIYIKSGASKKPVKYDGARDLDVLAKHIHAKGSKDFDLEAVLGTKKAATNNDEL